MRTRWLGSAGREARQPRAGEAWVGRRAGAVLGLPEAGLSGLNRGRRMAVNSRIPTDGGNNLGQNPFGALSVTGLPSGAAAPSLPVVDKKRPDAPAKNRGRVDIVRTTAGRGGKTVTVVRGFVGIGLPEKEQLAKRMQKIAGCGGTVKEGQIEIQGDKREAAARVLTEAGFRPVFAGG